MSLSETIQQWEEQIREAVENAVGGLKSELRERLQGHNQELLQAIDRLTSELPTRFLHEEDVSNLVQPTVDQAVREAVAKLQQESRSGALSELATALRDLDSARSQAEVLRALLDHAVSFASRGVIVLLRSGQPWAWGSRGFGSADEEFPEQPLAAAEGSCWERLQSATGVLMPSSGERVAVASLLDAAIANEAVLVPLVLRDRVAAGLYADRLGDDPLVLDALQNLTYVAALALETLPLRQRSSTATLAAVSGVAAPPAPEPGPVPSFEAAPPPIEAPAVSPEEPPPPAEAAPEPPEPSPPPSATPAETVLISRSDLPTGETVELGTTSEELEVTLGEKDEASEASLGAAYEDSFQVSSALEELAVDEDRGWQPAALKDEEEPAAVTIEEMEIEGEEAEEVDDLAAEPAAAPPAPTPTPPAEAPAAVKREAEPAGFGFPDLAREESARGDILGTNPQVEPPADVQGPGWAFTSSQPAIVDEDEEAAHDKALRLAKLLVSEIKLYNEEQVQEGRKNQDIAERLQEEINRSREVYEERVDPRVREKTDYFYQEMVRQLGGGDPKTLGI
jgi:hypothetical protein